MHTTRRHIDWVSIVELMRLPLVGSFFRALNAMPLDRGRVDAATVRSIIERLRRGRVVGIFPEAGIRTPTTSVLQGGSYRGGLGRIAQMAGVPIVPCVVVDTANFGRPGAWLPLRRTRFAVAYGEPLYVDRGLAPREARRAVEEAWRAAALALLEELKAAGVVWPPPAREPG
jgi:1-acyl-sn-glycerol-3-phosphate acyltransferase